MQILWWLFKGAQQQEEENNCTFNHSSRSFFAGGENGEGREINLQKQRGGARKKKTRKENEWSKLCSCCYDLKPLGFLFKRDAAAEACFYSTLNLKRLGDDKKGRFVAAYAAKMMKKREESSAANNKVLPITEALPPPLPQRLLLVPAEFYEGKRVAAAAAAAAEARGEKKKPISKMKELLRWAASAKTEKGGRKVSMFRKRGTMKEVAGCDDEFCIESPKISFRWNVDSCSTISSVYSATSIASPVSRNSQAAVSPGTFLPTAETGRNHSKEGSWTTTEEYVVLEL